MKRHLLATALAATTLTWAASPVALAKEPAAALAPAASPEAVGFDSARLKRLDGAMAQVVANGRVAGVQTLLARHGQVVSFIFSGLKIRLSMNSPRLWPVSRSTTAPCRSTATE